jgi:pyruvate/2-oxoglutarate dehydrogenase complex dihydrolipoamide acyltransferase (E2) component
LGGTAEKPRGADGQVAVGEILDMTLNFDCSLIDGAPVASFA